MNLEDLVTTIGALVAALLAYRLGLRAYFTQKEYENVRSRYLDSGVEIVSTQIDYVLGVFRHNWMLTLRTARQYRELEGEVSVDDFMKQFREVDQEKFQLTPIYRTKPLLNNDVLWRAYQDVFAFVGTTNNEIKSDFLGVLNGLLKKPDSADKKGFLKQVEVFTKEQETEANKYYSILNYLHQIAEILEKGKYTYKNIYNLHKTKEFSIIVTSLNKIFPKEQSPKI
ncbi:MAG: hypothetical protein JAZ13_20010 [Candidatus Thiodiazotropha taylori]|nr:hypothetical protein [Candidatus Thiodiazotropha taylori]